MPGKIDAPLVDHRHAKYHLEAATPFVKSGIPTFIAIPFCTTKFEKCVRTHIKCSTTFYGQIKMR